MPPPDVIYIRSNRSGFRHPEPSRFVATAKCILSVSLDTITAISSDIGAYQGFLDHAALSRVISRHVEDAEQVQKLARLVDSYDNLVNENGLTTADILKSIDSWRADTSDDDDTEGVVTLSDAEFALFGERLPLLLKRYNGLAQQRKAERLSEVLGQRLESIDVICDLRPVFDQNHASIIGVIPLTTIKLVCTGDDGLPVATQAVLSEKQVSELATLAQDAMKKLGALRGLASEVHKPVPVVTVTEQVPATEQGAK